MSKSTCNRVDDRAYFITNYIGSLLERTRAEKNQIRFGFDWVIYNIAIALDLQPIRLPFFRDPQKRAGRTKTEAEFGVDLAFVDSKATQLFIFVLKDEPLTNKTWTKHNFDSDLRMAACPDLEIEELVGISTVRVILAYNKDEDQAGTKLFKNLARQLGTRVGDNTKLSFERWNLSKISSLASQHLLSPHLLPQHLSGLLSYICSQVSDFDFGSEEWEKQLIPNWKRFLDELLQESINESRIRLVPLALVIIGEYRKDAPNSYPGWLDLVEWAMLKLWSLYPSLRKKREKEMVVEIWVRLYLVHLERYLIEITPALTTDHGIRSPSTGFLLDALNDSFVTYWHLERIGLHLLGTLEIAQPETEQQKDELGQLVMRASHLVERCIRANPSALRPLIDLHHIPLYLMWRILWECNNTREIYYMMASLEGRLLVRRIGKGDLPFIEGGNRIALVAETVATGDQPPEYIDDSSYLLQMLIELCFSLEANERDELVDRFIKRIVNVIGDDGQRFTDCEQIQLMSWTPPERWAERVVKDSVLDGVAVTTPFLGVEGGKAGYSDRIREFVFESREKFPSKLESKVPSSVLILGCIKNGSPLPPDFWRELLFPPQENKKNRSTQRKNTNSSARRRSRKSKK